MKEWYDPQWTEREYARGGARDDLGIESLSEGILADLLPGINNQTRRARYYSFWAWVLRDFILDSDVVHTQARLYEWLRPREAVLILAYLSHGCEGGVAGTQQGGRVWQDGEVRTYPLQWKSLVSVEGGGYQLYYRGVLQETNIMVRSEDSPHDDLTKTVGLELANAYGESVAETDYVRDFLDATRLRKAQIEDFAEYGCLCQLGNHEKERGLLIDTFFRFESPDLYAVKRLASLSFFLDIIDQANGEPLSQDDFRAVLYFWSFPDHQPYVPEGNLLSPAQRWRVFQLRQYFVFAIESFWSLFLHRVSIEALNGEEYLAWLLEELGLDALAEEFGIELPTDDARELSTRALYEAVVEALPSAALEPGPASMHSRPSEHSLTEKIRHEHSDLNGRVRAGYALVMLILIYWRCQSWRDKPGWVYASDQYAPGRLPIEGYLRHVERAFEEGWTLARWLGWFHHRYLWLQHRRVTLEKLLSRGQETSKFELMRQTSLDTATRSGRATEPRYKGLGVDTPKMNGPRFPSALSIMSDLGLIEQQEGDRYQLRPDGMGLLNRFRGYAVPEWTEYDADQTPDGTETPASR